MKKLLASALLSGLLLGLAWPTYGFSILIFIAFVPLLFLEYYIRKMYKHTKRKVFLYSYLTFLIWNMITTWWIWYATVFGMCFAILVNSLLMSIVFFLYHLVAKRLSQKMALFFLPSIWIIFEKFHLNWDFSWPWLNLGNVFSENIGWIQWYEYTGSFGGSLWVWIVNISIFLCLLQYKETKNRKVLSVGIGRSILLIAIPIIISLFLYQNYEEKGKPVSMIVLQPNIDPYKEKYNMSNSEIAQLLIRLTSEKMDNNVHFVLAPETVFADNIHRNSISQDYAIIQLRQYFNQYPKTSFIGGIAMIDFFTDKDKITPESNHWKDNIWYNDYNSAFLMKKGEPLEFYNKSKLVVGVENMPFKSILEPLLGSAMLDLGGTVAVKTTQEYPSALAGVNPSEVSAPIICYESIYGEYITEYIKNGANFLAIITNDAWWNDTQGHKQLLSYARLRAIETRKSVARSANTGISAFINQKGQIITSLEYEKQGSLKATVLLNDSLTFYTLYGDYIARIALFLAIFIGLYSFAREREISISEQKVFPR